MLGPWTISKLFLKPVSCVTHYFYEFCKEVDHHFPWFCINPSFNSASIFLTVIHLSYCFQGPSILTWGTLSHWSHMFQRFHIFLASLVMSRKYIRLEWFRRGNIDDIETVLYSLYWLTSSHDDKVIQTVLQLFFYFSIRVFFVDLFAGVIQYCTACNDSSHPMMIKLYRHYCSYFLFFHKSLFCWPFCWCNTVLYSL